MLALCLGQGRIFREILPKYQAIIVVGMQLTEVEGLKHVFPLRIHYNIPVRDLPDRHIHTLAIEVPNDIEMYRYLINLYLPKVSKLLMLPINEVTKTALETYNFTEVKEENGTYFIRP